MRLAMLGILAVLLPAPARAAAEQPALLRLTVEGGEFRAAMPDGRVLSGADLVGAKITFPGGALRVDSARVDAGIPQGDVWLYGLSMRADSGEWAPVCEADAKGERLVIPVAIAQGDGIDRFGLLCTAGALGKCIRFGYRPWALGPDGTTPLARYHAACVNLVRAAYGGPQRAWTRDGMKIDLYDDLGIQRPEPIDPMPFEAGWTEEGAVCLAHPRVPENGSLADIVAAHPRLAEASGAACTESAAREAGAILFNRSRHP